jgi:predicted dehydrogenase
MLAKSISEIPVQVALVGYGYWGPNLARCIAASNRARLAVICERSPERARAAHSDHTRVPVVCDIESVFRKPEISAVVLATAVDTHGELARRALEFGKHVLVEKPLASNASAAVALAKERARQNSVLMVDHTYLFSAALETVRQLIVDRRLGPLRYYQATRANCFGPQHDTNVLWDLAVHDLSILDALIASPPSRIQAVVLSAANGRRVSHAQLILTYPGSISASVLVSWIAPEKKRLVLLGFDGHTIVWDDLSPSWRVRLFKRGLEPVPDPLNRLHLNTCFENISVPPTEPLARMIEHFLDCIAHGVPPRSDAAAGMRVVRLLEAADRSLGNSGSPVATEIAERIDRSAVSHSVEETCPFSLSRPLG